MQESGKETNLVNKINCNITDRIIDSNAFWSNLQNIIWKLGQSNGAATWKLK